MPSSLQQLPARVLLAPLLAFALGAACARTETSRELRLERPLLFIGFSLGAGYGVPLVQAEPELYPRAVFIEGGVSAWNIAAAKRFAKAGGKRLILACGQAGCLTQVKQLGPALTRAGLETRVGGSASAGHTYDGSVAQVVSDNWDWLTEDDQRFAP